MGRSRIYPFDEMAVGAELKFEADSRAAEYPEGCTNSHVGAAAHQYNRQMKSRGFNVKLKSKRQPDGSVVIWRVE